MEEITIKINTPLKAVEETENYMLIIKDAKDVFHFFKKDGTYDGYDKKYKQKCKGG